MPQINPKTAGNFTHMLTGQLQYLVVSSFKTIESFLYPARGQKL